MEWLNLHSSVLDSEEVVGSDPVQRGTWLMLLRFCAGQENGGTIRDCRGWKDRKWQQVVRVTQEEVSDDCDLWQWDGDDLKVFLYPVEKEAQVKHLREIGKSNSPSKKQASRDNGSKGGRPRNPTENPTETQQKTREKPIEGKGREEEEEGEEEGNGTITPPNPPEGGNAKGGSSGQKPTYPTAAELIAEIPADWPQWRREIASQWAEDKQDRKTPKHRYKELSGWRMTLKRMALYSETVLRDAIDTAIASSYQGWEFEPQKKTLNQGTKPGIAPLIGDVPILNLNREDDGTEVPF